MNTNELLQELEKAAPYFHLIAQQSDFKLITVEEFLDAVLKLPTGPHDSLKLNPSTIFGLFGFPKHKRHTQRAAKWLRERGFYYHTRDGNFKVALKARNLEHEHLRLI